MTASPHSRPRRFFALTDTPTPWFAGHIRPAYVGVYQRRSGAVRTYSRWDGAQWHLSCQSAEGAARVGLPPSMNQRAEWRGLLAAPQ